MSRLSAIALGAGRANATTGRDVADIVTFIEAPWGLGMSLFPVQRVILKAYYGIVLDDNPHDFPLDVPIPSTHPAYDPDLLDSDGFYKNRIVVTDWRRQNPKYLTEAQYLLMLHAQGRCNIGTVTPGHERREMVLSIGRRSGKTTLSACIAAYETYRLISKGDPQKYYGVSASNPIQLVSVATDKEQAGLLYQEVSGHFRSCAFFSPYTANNTQTYARFQTPRDIERYGPYANDPGAKATIKVTFKSCVAKGLRGAGNIVVVLDEMAHFTDDGQSSADEVYKAIIPSTAMYSPKDPFNLRKSIGPVESKVIAISSPLGREGLFYKLFQDGFRGGSVGDDRLCVQAPTWEVNVTVAANFFESEYVKDPRTFFTEYGADFTDRTRGWIEVADDLLACIDKNLRPKMKAPPRMPHHMGIDVGLVVDSSAVAVGHKDDQGRVVVDLVDWITAGEGDYAGQPRLEFADVADWIADFTKRFYVHDGMFDQWAGIPMEQSLAAKGLRQLTATHHTPQLTSQMYQNFKDLMFDKRIVLYDWPIPPGKEHSLLIEQLLELQAEYKSKYVTLVKAPKISGKHDDLADALVRMVWLASRDITPTKSFGSPRYFAGQGNARPALSPGPTAQHDVTRAMLIARRKARQSGSSPERQIPRKQSLFGNKRGGGSFRGGR